MHYGNIGCFLAGHPAGRLSATVTFMATASLIVAIVAVIIAIASAAYARKQAVASTATAAIETGRRHDELTPELAASSAAAPGAGNSHPDLIIELTGPAGLDRLDEVTVRIRDDRPDRMPSVTSGLTQEQISGVIWGPYRLNPAAQETDPAGRVHGPFRLLKNEPRPVPLEKTWPPSWTTPNVWREYTGKPVRVEITCRRDGHEPWVIKREVRFKADPMTQVF